jgi:hypothetical protein
MLTKASRGKKWNNRVQLTVRHDEFYPVRARLEKEARPEETRYQRERERERERELVSHELMTES